MPISRQTSIDQIVSKQPYDAVGLRSAGSTTATILNQIGNDRTLQNVEIAEQII
ncbi:MAG: hypothetical protein HGB01_02615 [Chlorobiaceae bacterium]|nr:hypothetical protein [Chlorobiaceae bacterium]